MRLPATPITPTVVFDLDGTLVHTVPDIAEALDITLAPYGVGRTSIGEAASMMGDGLSEFFWKAMVSKRLNLPAAEADALIFGPQIELVDLALLGQPAGAAPAERGISHDRAADLDDQHGRRLADGVGPPVGAAPAEHGVERPMRDDPAIGAEPGLVMHLGDRLGVARPVVGFPLGDLRESADQEGGRRRGPLRVVQANPDAVGGQVAGDGDFELAALLRGDHVDARGPDLDRPGETARAGNDHLAAALSPGREQVRQGGRRRANLSRGEPKADGGAGAGEASRSGHFRNPLTPLAAHPNYTNGGEIPVAPRGSGIQTADGFRTRTPVVKRVDMQASYRLPLGGRRSLTLLADVFNLFNSRDVLMYDQWTQLTGPADNPDFGSPITQVLGGAPPQFQAPREVRLGARFGF